VVGSVLENIKRLAPQPFPPAVIQSLNHQHRQASLRDMQLIAALGQVQVLFAASQLEFLTLKGPALSQLLFGSPFVRHSIDPDLLIHEEDLLRAKNALLGIGYTPFFSQTAAERDAIQALQAIHLPFCLRP
jgi:hypothetical protein